MSYIEAICCKGHMTFCGIFPKLKNIPTVSLNVLLPDMPHVCHMYATCQHTCPRASFRTAPSSVLAGVRYGVFHGTKQNAGVFHGTDN